MPIVYPVDPSALAENSTVSSFANKFLPFNIDKTGLEGDEPYTTNETLELSFIPALFHAVTYAEYEPTSEGVKENVFPFKSCVIILLPSLSIHHHFSH